VEQMADREVEKRRQTKLVKDIAAPDMFQSSLPGTDCEALNKSNIKCSLEVHELPKVQNCEAQ